LPGSRRTEGRVMLEKELLEYLAQGENSGVEFKRDDIRPEQLAKEVVALANLRGGRIFLGAEDDGTVSGLSRKDAQEWVLNVFRDKVHPQIIPFYEEVSLESGKRVGVITVGPGISKPYVLRHHGREEIYLRMGNRSDLATREQQLRLFETGGMLHLEVLPLAGTSMQDLDMDRVDFYLRHIIRDPEIPETKEAWVARLLGMGFLAEDGLGNTVGSLGGMLCFGINPRRILRQGGLRIFAFEEKEKSYDALLDTVLDGPLVGRWRSFDDGRRELVDPGLIEKFTAAITPFVSRDAREIDASMRRQKEWHYPWEALREVVINALAHRDWSRSVDIEIGIYADRLEVISPGSLQNSMTLEKMIAGQRSPRNPLIMDVLRDYGYVESRGMGIRTKVIPLMRRCNGRDPVFELTEDYLKTVLYKKDSPPTPVQ